jgi:hypothetical protein
MNVEKFLYSVLLVGCLLECPSTPLLTCYIIVKYAFGEREKYNFLWKTDTGSEHIKKSQIFIITYVQGHEV